MPEARILAVRTGRIVPLGPDRVPSAIAKHARDGAVKVGPLGLDGDQQGDLSVHGGEEKAVYGYAAAHFTAWSRAFPDLAGQFVSGAMGENLTVAGLQESGICPGDVHAIGSALLQVCQPRRPCFKFALHMGSNQVLKAMVRTGHSGWYYRVLQPGSLSAGDAITLAERPNPDFSFTRLVQIVSFGRPTRAELERMADMEGLASQWRRRARMILGRP
jgi:MOSC domain-containing protein YiiM